MITDREKLETIQRYAGELLAAQQTSVTRVTTAQGLRDALAARRPQIIVAPGVYRGNFIIDAPLSLIEETPATAAIEPADVLEPTLLVFGSSVTVQGFTIRNGAADRDTVIVGDFDETDPRSQPDQVRFVGTSVVAGANGGKRAWALHGRRIRLEGCSAHNFWRKGQESQAVWCHNGPGPYEILGGVYEASGVNVLFGGAEIKTGVNPSGIITGATLQKPLHWRGQGYVIKNLFEVKAGKNIVLDDCTLSGCWGGEGQAGWAIVLTPETQGHVAPWLTVDYIIILNNRLLNCIDGAVNVLGQDQNAQTIPMTNLAIAGNYFRDCALGLQVLHAAQLGMSVTANTFPSITGRFLGLYGAPIAALAYRRNVVTAGAYGISGDDNVTAGLPSLQAAIANGDVSGFVDNVIEQSARFALKFPAGNRIVAPGELAALLDSEHRMLDKSAGYGV